MIILDDQARQTNDSSLPIVTSMQRFAHHGLRQAYSCINNHPTNNSSMPNNFHVQ